MQSDRLGCCRSALQLFDMRLPSISRRFSPVRARLLGFSLAAHRRLRPDGPALRDDRLAARRRNSWLVAVAGVLFLLAFALKGAGWRRLLARSERPGSHALAAANAAASVTGVALPGRFDDVVRIAVARRFSSRAGLGALCLSLVVVGLIDSAALTPLASVAAGLGGVSTGLRAGLGGRRRRRHRRGRRSCSRCRGSRAARGVDALPARPLARHAHATSRRDSTHARGRSSRRPGSCARSRSTSCSARSASGTRSRSRCSSSARRPRAAVLPLGPAGAATQAGAGAAVLAAAGVPVVAGGRVRRSQRRRSSCSPAPPWSCSPGHGRRGCASSPPAPSRQSGP